jgi:K+-transporting ATPase ATPase A chain
MVFTIYIILISIAAFGEYGGNPQVNNLLGAPQPNLEGKEVRFGWAETALWAVTTIGTMCGGVNGMHDSLMPPGGFATLFNLFLQIVWGGQGTGTAYLFIYSILSVFLTGVMYEYASAAANNGSGLEGLADSQPTPTGVWWNLSTC